MVVVGFPRDNEDRDSSFEASGDATNALSEENRLH